MLEYHDYTVTPNKSKCFNMFELPDAWGLDPDDGNTSDDLQPGSLAGTIAVKVRKTTSIPGLLTATVTASS